LLFSCTRHITAGPIAQFPRAGVVGTIIAACALTSCSVAIPVGSSSNSALWRGAPEDATGSIAKPAPKLSRRLDVEDLRRAMAALETALDPQGSGASVHWDNPQSGAKGSFTPSGQPYPVDAKVCRAFVAEISAQDDVEKLEGAACREKSADWTLTEVKPHKAGA
jgi:17 kDa outer membrane surface antigen